MEYIAIPVVVAIITYGIYRLFELFVRRRERLLLIEKLTELKELKGVPFQIPDFSPRLTVPFSFTPLRIGLTLLGVGAGFLIGSFLAMYCVPEVDPSFGFSSSRFRDALIGASTLIGGGLGLVIVYFLEKSQYNKEKNRE